MTDTIRVWIDDDDDDGGITLRLADRNDMNSRYVYEIDTDLYHRFIGGKKAYDAAVQELAGRYLHPRQKITRQARLKREAESYARQYEQHVQQHGTLGEQ